MWTDALVFIGRHPMQVLYGGLLLACLCLIVAAVYIVIRERQERRRQLASEARLQRVMQASTPPEWPRPVKPRASGHPSRRVG